MKGAAEVRPMRNADYYLSLNYHKRLYQDEEGDWIVEVDDLPGCVADGKTPDEAVENLRDAMTAWIDSRIEAGLEVPEPSVAEEYSGKILVRMPRFLHRRLSLQAKAEGVSLNQYIVSLLVDASRAGLTAAPVVQNVASFAANCRWYGVADPYAAQGGLVMNNSFYWGGSYPQAHYFFVGQQAPKQLAAAVLAPQTESA